MKSKSKLPFQLFTCFVSLGLLPPLALGDDFTWDGGGPDGSWMTGFNWVGDPASPPGMGIDSIQTFYATATNLVTFLGGSRVLGTLNFNADADSDISVRFAELAVGGLTRTLTFDVTTGNAALNVDPDATGNYTLGVSDAPGNIALSDSLVITHNGTGNLTINRPITLTTPSTLLSVTKAGTGTLTLASANTFDGGFILSAGTLNITDINAVGKATGALTIDGGAIDNTLSPAAAINIGARPLTINGDFTFKGTSGSTGTLNLGTGATTLGTAAGTTRTITVSASTLTIAGIIADGTTANGITKEGAGGPHIEWQEHLHRSDSCKLGQSLCRHSRHIHKQWSDRWRTGGNRNAAARRAGHDQHSHHICRRIRWYSWHPAAWRNNRRHAYFFHFGNLWQRSHLSLAGEYGLGHLR